MKPEQEALRSAIKTYLHANDYQPRFFALHLTKAPDLPKAQLLRAGLEEAIANSTVQPESFTDWTDALVDTQDELDGFLKALWDYVYADGPEPDLP